MLAATSPSETVPPFSEAYGIDAIGSEEGGHLVDAGDWNVEILGYLADVSGVVAVAVAEEDGGCAGGSFRLAAFGENRVAVYPRVDQQNLIADLDAEPRVTEPNDFHG